MFLNAIITDEILDELSKIDGVDKLIPDVPRPRQRPVLIWTPAMLQPIDETVPPIAKQKTKAADTDTRVVTTPTYTTMKRWQAIATVASATLLKWTFRAALFKFEQGKGEAAEGVCFGGAV